MVADFEHRLLNWGAENYRRFPWRAAENPFFVLLAEKLLQQTAARSSVVDAYLTVVERFPTPELLRRAEVSELRRIVAPLGFTFRAEELKALASALVEQHAGLVPAKHQDLMRLPGVGEYISRAVLCFGYGEAVGIVDANVARLFNRLFKLLPQTPANPARNKVFLSFADRAVSRSFPREFNFAILDLCSKACKAARPLCGECPFRSDCPSARNAP